MKLLPRVVIGAPQGRSGKTTVSLGICAALAGRKMVVQPYKKGPDYIDPSWLSKASGRACRSLDPFFLEAGGGESDECLQAALLRGASGAELALIEGNHGLYDSSYSTGDVDDGRGSTAAVARAIQSPVLLVVNAARMSRSAAAMVKGYQLFEPETNIAGVILNQVARSRQLDRMRIAIEKYCRIPVLGALPKDTALEIPDRHLGLVPVRETYSHFSVIEACKEIAERYLDLDAIYQIARSAPALAGPADGSKPPSPHLVDIGVLLDQAFSFYYPENFEALEQAGARLVFVDAQHDSSLPPVDALYIGGGFPEVFMEQLSANTGLRADIARAVNAGLPVYAECGGLMYLSRRIVWGEHSADMVGVLPCDVEMFDRPAGHGYVIATTNGNDPFFSAGANLRGHEFHHSRVTHLDAGLRHAYNLSRGDGIGGGVDGLVYRNVLASYTHLHAHGAPEWAGRFVDRALTWRNIHV